MGKHLGFVALILVISLLLGSYVLQSIDPESPRSVFGLITIFLTAFTGASSFGVLFFFFGAELWRQKPLGETEFAVAFRRGLFLGSATAICIGLQLFRFLGVIETISVILFFVFLEGIALTTNTNPENNPNST